MEDWQTVEELLEAEVAAPQLLIAELTGNQPPAVLALLRAFPARRVVLRGVGAPEVEALRAAGIDAVLSRPCTIGDIVDAARRLLVDQAADKARRGRPGRQQRNIVFG
jgi:predicted Fe-Mo cluster-binding NifX family protein